MKKFFKEMIPVVIGVYLGFFLANWGEKRQLKKDKKQLIENLIVEIKGNQERIDKVQDYHTELLQAATTIMVSDEPKIPETFKGISMPSLNESVYQTAIQTGLMNEIPLSQIELINGLYSAQEGYNNYQEMLIASFVNFDFDMTPKNLKKIAQFLQITMTDVTIKERELQEGYEKILTELEKK